MGKKSSKSGWWNDEVKVAEVRKDEVWKDILGIREGIIKEKCGLIDVCMRVKGCT